ncbi:MAG: alpha/beta hydrolase [Desulfobulbaceae bacterium]|nr:alpha/beta hydrolase [Desulfobulbaceae bacterium]
MNIIILPGMGADSRMYNDNAYKSISGIEFVNWPLYKGEQSISEMAARIIKEKNIDERHIVGGSSLGGVVAAEIANQIKIQKLILIGSTLTPQAINPILKKFHHMAEIAPVDLIQLLAGKATLSYENILFGMFSQSDSSFIKAMSKAIFKWGGNTKPNCEVCHIHGEIDKVIYPPKDGAEIIWRGGHLIAITHSSVVAKFINKSTKS